MTSEQRRDDSGRFKHRLGQDILLAIVRRVCETAATALGTAPGAVSQRAYDDHRAAAGFPGSPRAYRVVKQLGLPWRELLASLFDEGRSTKMTLVAQTGTPDAPPDEEAIVYALRVVAGRLNKNTLRRDDYEAERLRVQGEADRHWLHGTRQPLLPTAGQIENAIPWDEALAKAGLEARASVTVEAGVTWVLLAGMFLEELGYLPRSVHDLQRYARDKNVILAGRNADGKSGMGPVLDELRVVWEAQGRWFPSQTPRRREQLPWAVTPLDETAGLPIRTRSRNPEWSLEDCIAGLVRALDEVPKLTQPELRRISKGRSDVPNPSVVDRVAKRNGTTAKAIRDQAVRRKLADGNAP